jgi:hypothetical protein
MKILKIKPIFLLITIMVISCEKTIDTEILRFYGDAYEDIGYSIAKAGNEYYITGQHTVITRADGRITGDLEKLVLVETTVNGSEIRRNVTNTTLVSTGRKVITLEDGSSVVAGSIISESKQKHVYIVKFAPGGEGYTDKIFSELNGNVYANDILKTPEGYLVLATTDYERGSSDDTGNQSGKKDVLLLSLNDDLQLIRSIPYGFTGNDEGIALKPDRFGGYVVVGTTDRYSDQTGTDVFILSVNEDISNVSARSGRFIELAGDQSAADFEVTNDGYLIAGNTVSGASRSGFAMKIAGTIWGQEDYIDIKMNNSFSINAICSYKSNSFLMAGQYGSLTSGSMLIFVTDKLGNIVEGKTRIAGGTGNQVVYDVFADSEDIIAVGGNSYDNNSMITFLKFRF